MTRKDEVLAVVLGFVQAKDRLPNDIDLERFDYLEQGYVDSIGIIRFMMLLEDRFGVQFSDDDIASPRFRCVGGVVAMVMEKLREGPGND